MSKNKFDVANATAVGVESIPGRPSRPAPDVAPKQSAADKPEPALARFVESEPDAGLQIVGDKGDAVVEVQLSKSASGFGSWDRETVLANTKSLAQTAVNLVEGHEPNYTPESRIEITLRLTNS
jgi:hypothetical protein